MKFIELKLERNLLKGIEDAGFTECTKVQEATFAHTLKGKDVCVQSQTGTGKTAAFLITIFQLLLTGEIKKKKALIIAPTRELADQIEKEAKVLGRHLKFTIGSFYGGVGYVTQEKLVEEGVDIIIGTPGRLIDFNQSHKLDFRQIGILVIDEADRLFDMGFLPDLRKMLKRMPKYDQRMTMLFSATLSHRARELAWEYMNNPKEIALSPEQITVDNITQELYHVGGHEKMSLLLGILNKEKPKSTLIFTNTKHAAVEVATRLSRNGYPCEYIIGDLPQNKRNKVIEGLKSGQIPLLVATNVAARGLHVDDLDLVLNYDLPEDCEDYVHRIGRTARAGKSGKAISLACEKYVYGLESIEDYIKMPIPVIWADKELFVVDKSAGMRIRVDSPPNAREQFSKGRSSEGKRRPTEKIEPGRRNPPTRQAKPLHSSKPETSPGGTTKTRQPAVFNKPASGNKKVSPVKEKSPKPKNANTRPESKPMRSQEERLAYYSKKYGENFKAKTEAKITPQERPVKAHETVPAPSHKPTKKKQTLLKKIFGRFSSE
jgi:ATP-dependent RNA helicase RhlB